MRQQSAPTTLKKRKRPAPLRAPVPSLPIAPAFPPDDIVDDGIVHHHQGTDGREDPVLSELLLIELGDFYTREENDDHWMSKMSDIQGALDFSEPVRRRSSYGRH